MTRPQKLRAETHITQSIMFHRGHQNENKKLLNAKRKNLNLYNSVKERKMQIENSSSANYYTVQAPAHDQLPLHVL